MIRKGLCGDKNPHKAHFHDSRTLGHYWCKGVEERPDREDAQHAH